MKLWIRVMSLRSSVAMARVDVLMARASVRTLAVVHAPRFMRHDAQEQLVSHSASLAWYVRELDIALVTYARMYPLVRHG
jgi:hypothetical protein